MGKITVLIPCHNEEDGIANVIHGFPRERLARHGLELDVLVIDNNSTDKTAEVATAAGARVIHEPKKGKGNAIKTGFYNIADDTDYVVMLDGDDTYRPQEILRLIEPLESGFCNVVIGSRLGGRISEGSMKAFNRLGNWVFSHLVRYVYRVNVTDVLTGYFAWTRQAVEDLRPHLESSGFAIEMEMITRMARLGEEIYSVPISYHARAGESSLRPVYDGSRILAMFGRNLRWKPSTPRPKRLAIVSDSIYPYNRGGKETRIYQLSHHAAEHGYDVHIYTMQWWQGPKTRIENGVTLHAISKLYPLYAGNRRSIKQGLFFSLACFKLLGKKFDAMEVDHMPYFPIYTTWLVCLLRRKPLIATWHEVWGKDYWKQYMGKSGGMAWWLERFSVGLPKRIIAVSNLTAQRLQTVLRVKNELPIVPNGIDLAYIDSVKPAKNHTNIIFVGRLISHKNVDVLLHAIKIAKAQRADISASIVGTGPELDSLKQLAKSLRLSKAVKFYGLVKKDDDMLALMKAADVFVTPSTREGFGITVLEANACGLPVITVNHPHNAGKDLIRQGKNGEVVGLSADELAEAMLRALQKPLDPQVVRQVATEFNWQTVADNYLEHIA